MGIVSRSNLIQALALVASQPENDLLSDRGIRSAILQTRGAIPERLRRAQHRRFEWCCTSLGCRGSPQQWRKRARASRMHHLGAAPQRIECGRWLPTAAGVPGIVGFALGRTLFWEPLVAWRDGKIQQQQKRDHRADIWNGVKVFEGGVRA